MEIDLTKEENIKQTNGFVVFIPKRLDIKDRPELTIFPLNILIGRYTMRNGGKVFGSVCYEPDLSTFFHDKENDIVYMGYYNPYNRDYNIALIFYIIPLEYEALKCVRGEQVSLACGKIKNDKDEDGWRNFFIHVSFLGFEQGETCYFLDLEENLPPTKRSSDFPLYQDKKI